MKRLSIFLLIFMALTSFLIASDLDQPENRHGNIISADEIADLYHMIKGDSTFDNININGVIDVGSDSVVAFPDSVTISGVLTAVELDVDSLTVDSLISVEYVLADSVSIDTLLTVADIDADSASIDELTSVYLVTDSVLVDSFLTAEYLVADSAALSYVDADSVFADTLALTGGATIAGKTTLSDTLSLPSSGVIDWNSGDVTITNNAADQLKFDGACYGFNTAPSAGYLLKLNAQASDSRAIHIYKSDDGTGGGQQYGINMDVNHMSGSTTHLYGHYLTGVGSQAGSPKTGTISNSYGMFLNLIGSENSAISRNAYGIYVNKVRAINSDSGNDHYAYGIYLADNIVSSGGDNNYAYPIYSAATEGSYFAGGLETAGTVTADSVSTGSLTVSSPAVPGAANASGVAGTVAWDADYIYICVSTDTWKRAEISTW